jgi:hypothetical protein
MTDLERVLIETVSYCMSLDGRVLFCRFCGLATSEVVDVGNRYCPTCRVWHDNTRLEAHLQAAQA